MKPVVYSAGGAGCMRAATTSLSVGVQCARVALLCIAPVMPYITEELYHSLPPVWDLHNKQSLMAEQYPLPEHVTNNLFMPTKCIIIIMFI